MSKLHLNLHFSSKDFLKHLLRIVLSIVAIYFFHKYFPADMIPQRNVFKIVIYMCIYIFVSLIIEVIWQKVDKGHKK